MRAAVERKEQQDICDDLHFIKNINKMIYIKKITSIKLSDDLKRLEYSAHVVWTDVVFCF